MQNLAATYWKLGKVKDAEELDIAVLEKRKQMLGPEYPHSLTAMSNLATTYLQRQRHSRWWCWTRGSSYWAQNIQIL
jgi:hypothetical protein